jgi:hypothetical protein
MFYPSIPPCYLQNGRERTLGTGRGRWWTDVLKLQTRIRQSFDVQVRVNRRFSGCLRAAGWCLLACGWLKKEAGTRNSGPNGVKFSGVTPMVPPGDALGCATVCGSCGGVSDFFKTTSLRCHPNTKVHLFSPTIHPRTKMHAPILRKMSRAID